MFTLPLYFFRQFIPPFLFGSVLFVSVLFLDKFFDMVDLIFNRGVAVWVVFKLFLLFLPTIVPLTLPMAVLLGSVITFGRLSEENQLTAVRSAGISLMKVLWTVPLFALLLSLLMIPFNTVVAPFSNNQFRVIYEEIIHADPLVKIDPRSFFSIKNIKIFAESIDSQSKRLENVFVYQMTPDGRPTDRIFARSGVVEANGTHFKMNLREGQLERYDLNDPTRLTHTSFGEYQIAVPLKLDENFNSTRFRNLSNKELRKLIADLRSKGISSAPVEAEKNLRYAMAFAPLALAAIGLPLATALKKGGRTFSFGITIIVIFVYYLFLIFGLTMAEKGLIPAPISLWIANIVCLAAAALFVRRMLKQ